MSIPTIEARLQKRFVFFSSDSVLAHAVEKILPSDWQMVVTTSLETLGAWNEVLLYRFLFLDLDERHLFDPLDVVAVIRQEYQINLPVLCFGGDRELQEAMRLQRADRFFTREEVLDKVLVFCRQYDWGAHD